MRRTDRAGAGKYSPRWVRSYRRIAVAPADAGLTTRVCTGVGPYHRRVITTPPLAATETEALTRRGLRLAQLTVAYNVAEGLVAVGAGLAAGLVSVIGFGIDSGIESVAAVLVGLRLAARLRRGTSLRLAARLRRGTADEDRERLVLRAVAVTFFVLAAYVTVAGIRALAGGQTPEASPVGIGVLLASVVVMPLLARAKRRVGLRLGDNLILADAAETRICVLLSLSTLAGIALFQLTGAAWLDPVAGFVIAAFAVHEGREAWEGELVEDDDEAEDEDDADVAEGDDAQAHAGGAR